MGQESEPSAMDDETVVLSRIARVKRAIVDIESVVENAEPEEFLALMEHINACTAKMKVCIDNGLEMTARDVYELDLARDRLIVAYFRLRFIGGHSRDP
ncbi:MAG TPA: hypothetical protein VLB83_04035 [Candidatus Paceibacterota bacterium]|nr:hypothetical protein [Candidatus Paceibacterota bacterium]